MTNSLSVFSLDYQVAKIGQSQVIHADCFEWFGRIAKDSIHAIVTDPPYGVKEYNFDQLDKRTNGNGGIWRLPPAFDGNVRSPLPRFTALSEKERKQLYRFFFEWGKLSLQALAPGGHIFLASNTFLSQLVFSALVKSGLEYRGSIIRLVRTLRGGDRPKNAEDEFPEVCSLPRGCYEPWGLFRKPIPAGLTLRECLRRYCTGGLRRKIDNTPFEDVIDNERTPKSERLIADHPSLKPQSFMRKIVYSALPLGEGIVLDPFMGSGSTIAAAESVGYTSIGLERHNDYYRMALEAIPELAAINKGEKQMSIFAC